MTDTITGRILLNNKSPVGGGFVELFDDGTVRAGQYETTKRKFGSTDEAYAHFRPMAVGIGGHWAWNICYVLEDYMAGRDDGR